MLPSPHTDLYSTVHYIPDRQRGTTILYLAVPHAPLTLHGDWFSNLGHRSTRIGVSLHNNILLFLKYLLVYFCLVGFCCCLFLCFLVVVISTNMWFHPSPPFPTPIWIRKYAVFLSLCKIQSVSVLHYFLTWKWPEQKPHWRSHRSIFRCALHPRQVEARDNNPLLSSTTCSPHPTQIYIPLCTSSQTDSEGQQSFT